ncbi:MAG TPA: efflux RND transporter periplasmic adaptor subunit [Bacteroidetes bacterium]|nr:efflux RND transporter periplasmic adaptor subunit [Bacteroidota bacterium]
MKKKPFRYILIGVILLLILAVVGKSLGWFGREYRLKVAVEKAERRTVVELITANGKIQPETEVKISPEISGEIVELPVKEGDEVKAGDLLVKINPDIYISARDQAMAQLNTAKARLAQSEAQLLQSELAFKRNRQLFEQNAISQADFESTEASYKMAQAEYRAAEFSVKSAEASLKRADEDLIKTTIYAPMSGTISMLLVEKGERVVGTSMMSGTDLMRIADLERMEVVVEVNENDIIRVSHGDTAFVEVDAYLDKTFRGVVTEIANSATTTGVATDQVTSFNVKILLLRESYQDLINENMKNPFRPGMSATVDIQTETRHHVLSVPIQSVTTRIDSTGKVKETTITDEEYREVVFVVRRDTAFMQEVETGIQDDRYIEILKGLTDTCRVVKAPYSAIARKLEHLMPVEIVSEDALFREEE